jgi:hypothetical protein
MARLLQLLGLVGSLALCCASAAAQRGEADDPYLYNLRTALFPVAFVAGISQSHFGSAARGEIDLARRITLQVSGQGAWLNVTGQSGPTTFALRAGMIFNLVDVEEATPLSGTVYPKDAPAAGGHGPGTDHDLDVPVSSKLGGPELRAPDQDDSISAPLRRTQSIRVGYDLARAVERGRPDAFDGSARYLLNTFHALYVGYGWSTHWNLSAAAAGGEPQVGWRRFYVDAVLTLPALVSSRTIAGKSDGQEQLFPIGARIGMEGAIGALIHSARGVGFGYSLELGALPGRSGVEGYLFVGLGLSLDMSAHGRSRRR